MGSYAHFHDAIFAFKALWFPGPKSSLASLARLFHPYNVSMLTPSSFAVLLSQVL